MRPFPWPEIGHFAWVLILHEAAIEVPMAEPALRLGQFVK